MSVLVFYILSFNLRIRGIWYEFLLVFTLLIVTTYKFWDWKTNHPIQINHSTGLLFYMRTYQKKPNFTLSVVIELK